MNYEQKYNEALEMARMYHNNAKDAGDYSAVARYENIFPELSESEDERTRKNIIAYLKYERKSTQEEINEVFIPWLEKQKEQKPVEKPNLVAELKHHLAITPKEQLEKEWKELEYWGNIGPTVQEFLYGKHVGWSEEDEEILNELLDYCNTENARWYNWLKSRCFRAKQEWGEEDERMLSRCIKSIESSKQFADSETFKKAKDKEIDWLENRLKSLRPQPKQECKSEQGTAIEIDNNIGSFEAYLISPEGENLGLITNIISLDDVRRQIKKEQAKGYNFLFNGELISIDRNGTLSEWPDEFCHHTKILLDLI